jgi:hypothetical protein
MLFVLQATPALYFGESSYLQSVYEIEMCLDWRISLLKSRSCIV